ncbi:MAG: GHKL domain-containing protein [Defluviitaleaceae bacterium]|nr:GHKL domain-containing protein [Defluviitaleaceae bacterium]
MVIQIFSMLLIEFTIYYFVFTNISNIEFRKTEAIIAILFMTIVAFGVYNYTMPGSDVVAMIINIFQIATMVLIATIKIRTLSLNLFYAVFASVIYLLAGNLSNAIMLFVKEFSSEVYFLSGWIISLAYLSIIFVLAFFISQQAGNVLRSKFYNFDNETKKKFAIYMICGAFIVFVYFFANTFFIIRTDTMMGVHFFSFTIYFGFFAFAIITFADKFQNEIEIKHQNELLVNLQTYTTELIESAIKAKGLIHDHKNILLGFYGLLESNDINGAREYYKNYMVAFDKVATSNSPLNILARLEISELRSILLLKLLYAQQQDINVHIEMVQTIKEVKISKLIDVCRIFGILLDNTIESCKSCKDTRQPMIKFMALKSKSTIIFAFANTCSNPPPLDKIFEKGFTTKSGDRGYGLYIISCLLSKNENLTISTHIKDGYFTQKLTVIID